MARNEGEREMGNDMQERSPATLEPEILQFTVGGWCLNPPQPRATQIHCILMKSFIFKIKVLSEKTKTKQKAFFFFF